MLSAYTKHYIRLFVISLILLVFSPLNALAKKNNKQTSFNCDEMLARYEKCDASTRFIELYRMLCTRGHELSPAERLSIHKFFQSEIAANECLKKHYKPARIDRKTRVEQKKQLSLEKKQKLTTEKNK